MKTILNGFATLTFILLSTSAIKSQTTPIPKWEFGLSAGASIYQGDLAPSVVGSPKFIDPVIAASVSRILTPHWSLRTSLAMAALRGDDRKYNSDAWRQARALKFKTSVFEVAETAVYDVFGNNDDHLRTRFSPYLFAGIGYSFLHVRRDASAFDSAFFGPHHEIIDGLRADLAHRPPRGVVVLPVGAGLRYALTPAWSLNLEADYRFIQTDYLDGFSHVGNDGRNDHYYTVTMGVLFTLLPDKGLKCPKPDGTVF